MSSKKIIILGAGITGLWQALTHARKGHQVTLIEECQKPSRAASSQFAGAMLAPYCEAENAEPIIQELGLKSLEIWKKYFPDLQLKGTLVLAQPRDQAELKKFARDTQGHKRIHENEIANLEPDLGERFSSGLFYPDEAHLNPRATMRKLHEIIEQAGVTVKHGDAASNQSLTASDHIIDCTGIAARKDLKNLRGVRGEMAVVKSTEINISRPVRLLHPRFPLYIVPWGEGQYMLGATLIERADNGPVTLRSALELLSTAYALHPAFGEAEILELSAGVRPAFPDNIPKIVLRGRHIYINGLYRHGFLLAPVLAELTSHYIETGEQTSELMIED